MKPLTVTMIWGDGEYPFALKIGQVRELESLKNVGIGAIYQRLLSGQWYGDDAYHVIRLGLIGGGMQPVDALQKCQTYVLDRPLAESVRYATAILLVLFHGGDDDPGKAEVAETAASPATE